VPKFEVSGGIREQKRFSSDWGIGEKVQTGRICGGDTFGWESKRLTASDIFELRPLLMILSNSYECFRYLFHEQCSDTP
jgi:hypothetical protein